MLVHIHDSLERVTGNRSEVVATFLDYVTLAHREGKHIFTGSAATLRALAGRSAKPEVRGALRTIAARTAESNGLKNLLPFYVEVGVGADFLNIRAAHDAQSVLRLDAGWFDDSVTVQDSVLLAENGRDAELYVELARSLVQKMHWNIKLKVETRGAGGSNVAREFETATRSKRPCLCVVDSDRCCPQCGIGRTARAVLNVTVTNVHEATLTTGREIENLLPISVLDLALAASHAESLKQYERLLLRNQAAALFLDLKRGMRAGHVYSLPNGHESQFWKEVDRVLLNDLKEYRHCSEFESCTSATCSCVMCCGFGDSVLDKVLTAIRSCSGKARGRLLAACEPGLEEVCLKVIAYGCANAAVRT